MPSIVHGFMSLGNCALRNEHAFSCLKRTVALLQAQGSFDILRGMRNESLKLAFLLFGAIAATDIDVAVVRSLALKYLMGLFDDHERCANRDEGG